MIEGWTKNLALLFNNALALALWRALDFLLLFGLPVLAVELWNARLAPHSLQWLAAGWVLALLWVRTLVRFYTRVAKSNFPLLRLRADSVGLAAVCRPALPKLVSAPRPQAGKLEGKKLQTLNAIWKHRIRSPESTLIHSISSSSNKRCHQTGVVIQRPSRDNCRLPSPVHACIVSLENDAPFGRRV